MLFRLTVGQVVQLADQLVRVARLGLQLICERWCRMAFRPPNFNLTANVWRNSGTGGAYATPDLVTPAALSVGRRGLMQVQPITLQHATQVAVEILLPKLTDVRCGNFTTTLDLMEIPAGSKRFYAIVFVDDVGKGWPNEYRLALGLMYLASPSNLTPPQATPTPLP